MTRCARTIPREMGHPIAPITAEPAFLRRETPEQFPVEDRIPSGRVLMHESLPFERDL